MTSRNYGHVIEAVRSAYWAIMPNKLRAICDFLDFKAAGGVLTAEQIASVAAARSRTSATRKSVQVLFLTGVISQRMDMITEASGGTSTDRFASEFSSAINDSTVSAVVLDVDSPGGSVYGVQELSDTIYAARGSKPIVAVANSLMASAAYWVASAADEIVITPGGESGSIGVVALHTDISGMARKEGLAYSLVSAGKYKTEANQFEPLADDSRRSIQKRVDEYYEGFVSTVARNRGVRRRAVASGFGEGRVLGAKESVSEGLADKVGTLDSVLSRLVKE
jgi:signal peptide peptidase SppA